MSEHGARVARFVPPPRAAADDVDVSAGAVRRLDQSRAPLVEAVEDYRRRGTLSYHCPAHRAGSAAPDGLRDLVGDAALTADVWLDPATQDAVRREAEDLAADLWGADRAFLLGNGSSGGNHALLLATVRPGDEVVVARDAHISTMTGLVLTGATPVWLHPSVDAANDVALPVTPDHLAATLREHPRARLVVLTSPTYTGVCADLAALVAVAHAAGVPVAVDEAWGAHLPFHPWLPADAMSSGADAVVTSTHKLGGSLSQSGLLLVRDARLDPAAVAVAVRMTATTSPYLPLLASVDAARRELALRGRPVLDRALAGAVLLRATLAQLPGVRVLAEADLGLPVGRLDPLKVAVDVTGLGLTGVDVATTLRREHDIAVEGSDLRRVFLVVSPGDTATSVDRVAAAMAAVRVARGGALSAPELRLPVVGGALAPQPAVCTPREAYFASSRPVPLAQAVGRVAAELVTPYPPGVPALVPGEFVGARTVSYLVAAGAAGVHMHGAGDPTLETVRVLG